MRDLNDREDRARQEAANAAEQAAYGVNKQASDQAYRAAMSPAEYFQAIQSPYVVGLQSQFASEQEKQRFEYEKQLAEQKFKQAQKLQKSGGGGGYDQAAADRRFAELMIGQYPQGQGGQQQPSTGQSFGQGLAQGGMLATINRR